MEDYTFKDYIPLIISLSVLAAIVITKLILVYKQRHGKL